MKSGKTGGPPGLLQDDDRKLSKWFASRLGARYQVRKNVMEKQPEALRLLGYYDYHGFFDSDRKAAAELRRLHTEREAWKRWCQEAEERGAALEKALGMAVEALEADDSKLWPSEKRTDALATARQTLK